jgi:methionyl aminopeptidase
MTVNNEDDLAALRRVGRVVALALQAMKEAVRPGVTTAELDAVGAAVLRRHGARSAPQLVYGFPGVNCIGLNDEAVHGVPSDRAIQRGDLVKLDVTAELDGYITDAAITVPVFPVSNEAKKIGAAAEAAFWKAVRVARAGQPINGIGKAIEGEARHRGFRVLVELHSHGVGRTIHEPPSFPQYDDPKYLGNLTEGLVITIEPILSAGSNRTVQGRDGWTLSTADGSISAHYEHTVVVTRGKPIILTAA